MSRTDYIQIKSTLQSEGKTKVFKGIFLERRRQTLRYRTLYGKHLAHLSSLVLFNN